ncbi:MAG: oxalyl-CoA decarboxylase [Alphaproteobacteria bacterium]|nr:MAG: oxalyl-CoA decarboxylase [Alphaproteobacteria bacterium]
MAEIDGATLMARALKQQGVKFMYGIVGFPVIPIAMAAQREGIRYIGMRNEQSASYAAQAAGYLLGRPQACLVVSGPGVVHALSGLANAQQNCWPMILIGGANSTSQNGMQAFQEERQVHIASPFCKYAHGVESVDRIPFYVEQAIRTALYGRPGAAYLDMPEDVISGLVEEDDIDFPATIAEPPRSLAPPENIEAALDVLEGAEKPLVIIGKGMAWARAEDDVRAFIERTQLPFLASPMGKGVMPDDHSLSVGAARTLALQEADTIFLMGARFNWIMHFGLPPRFGKNTRIIQLDSTAEEISHNRETEVALLGDGKAIVGQLNDALKNRQWFFPTGTDWQAALSEKAAANAAAVAPMVDDNTKPMNYYRAYRDIVDRLPKDAMIIGEGANTMDIGRTQMPNLEPRRRLDAGTYGTMGVGLGFAIAAATVHPDRPTIVVQGDSAFGFSGMEMETAARYRLPIKVIILNNGGIGGGAPEPEDGVDRLPHALMHGARYDKMAEAFGGKGFHVDDPADLGAVLDEALAFDGMVIVNVVIAADAGRKPQAHHWHG